MGAASFVQSSFLGGAWAPTIQGRIDRPDYRTAMNVCLNSFPMDTGAWTRRPGTRTRQTTRNGANGRVQEFNFRQDAPYTLEFTDNFLRFFSGDTLVATNDQQTITSITTANPAIFSTTTAHGWPTGGSVYFGNMSNKTLALHGRVFKLVVLGSNTFTLTAALSGAAISGAALGAINAGMYVRRVLEIATPYGSGSWSEVRLVQFEDGSVINALLLHPTIKPYVLALTAAPTESTFATFTLTAANFQDGPYLDPFVNGVQATPASLTGLVNFTIGFDAYSATKTYDIGAYVVSASINYRSLITANLGNTPATSPTAWVVVQSTEAIGPNGFQGSDIGRHVRFFSEPADWVAATSYVIGNNVKYNGSYWKALVAGAGNQPGIDLTKWAIDAAGGKWTWGKITALLNQVALGAGTPFGSMTGGGGLAAAFDGNVSQARAAAANNSVSGTYGFPGATIALSSAIGKGYTPTRTITFGTLFPSTDIGVCGGTASPGSLGTANVTINLRASNTAPLTPSDGTLLGTTGLVANPTSAITINSSDMTTLWTYVWFEIVSSTVGTSSTKGATSYTIYNTCAEAQFFSTSTGAGNGITVQILGPDLLYTVAIRTWRLGLYSDTTGWPSCGTSHEGRLWLSGLKANRVDASTSNHPYLFPPTGPTGAIADSNAIAAVFNSADVNPVFWLSPDERGIIGGTQGGEWLVSPSQAGPFSPTNTSARRITKNGCANVEPRRTGLTTTIVQRYKKKLLEYFADVYSGKFASPNLSLTGRHISNRGIEEIAYQNELTPIIWARMTDGTLAGVSYKRESLASAQAPNFAGWHNHVLGHSRTVTSLCHGGSADGLLDTIVMVTRDEATAVNYVEALTNIFEEDAKIVAARFLDGMVEASSFSVSGTTLTINGLAIHEGLSVTIWAGGVDCGQHTVTNGSTTVTLPTGLLTAARVTALGSAMTIAAGFSYTSQGQIIRPASAAETGARTGPGWGKMRRTQKFAALLQDTQGISFGTSFAAAKMNEANFETPGGTRNTKLELYSGLIAIPLTDSPSLDSMICWQISRPYPATIAALSGMLHTEDE